MKAKINSGCISCGICEMTCPQVFRMGNDNQAEVYADVPKGMESFVKQAEENCPVQVIEVQE